MRRSGLKIMAQLIVLIKDLLPVMLIAIVLGVLGFLCAIYVTVYSVYALFSVEPLNFSTVLTIVLSLAVLRGVLHYGEQYCNHFIAFKLLAIIRHKIFANLRKLSPAKLEGKDKGNLISIISSDIELLEVFYAHTISPIAIGVLTSGIMVYINFQRSFIAGIISLCAYIIVGFILPLIMGKLGGRKGMSLRNEVGDLNSLVLDGLRGIDETIQYDNGEDRIKLINSKSIQLIYLQKDLNKFEGIQRAVTNSLVLIFTLIITYAMFNNKDLDFADGVLCIVSLMSSFGPVIALSNLSNNLNQTLASGERVLTLLEEKPVVNENYDGKDIVFEGAEVNNVDFAYKDEEILEGFSLNIPKGKILGIFGNSGSGKSTLLKLLMRFWDVNSGDINISKTDIKDIKTDSLRKSEAFVTQDTYLFNDTIFNNITLRKKYSDNEVVEACKKASIHDFIISLKDGYQSNVGELGDILSGGEKQRIGLARAFLHNAPFMLFDEPTSNLDSLNEGIILKSLNEYKKDKTILIVSHRQSTLGFCDETIEMKSKRKS